jgi:hypothetical protein
VAQLAKGSFELREQRAFGAALEYFGDKGAPGFENLRGDGECRLGERDNSRVVGRGVAVVDGAMSLSTTSAEPPSSASMAAATAAS